VSSNKQTLGKELASAMKRFVNKDPLPDINNLAEDFNLLQIRPPHPERFRNEINMDAFAANHHVLGHPIKPHKRIEKGL
jgi:hypothetical protein